MGEWSKKIGEYGENIVEKFFKVIGWHDLIKGVDISCLNQVKHTNRDNKARKTHGVDFLYTYMSPLVSNQLNNIIISVKYKTSKYPNNPTTLFKNFMDDLITSLECFDFSQEKNNIINGYSYSSVNDIGVLFWLNNQTDSNDDLINTVSSARIENVGNKTIFIMDNKRVGFILEVMRCIKSCESEYTHAFYYPNTGQNINPINRVNIGSILPVEYLNSSIIPIKLENKFNSKETCLFLATLDDFEEEDLLRLMGLAKDISTDLVGEVIIAFHDYNELNHSNIVSRAKHKFQAINFTKTVRVINFSNPLDIL